MNKIVGGIMLAIIIVPMFIMSVYGMFLDLGMKKGLTFLAILFAVLGWIGLAFYFLAH